MSNRGRIDYGMLVHMLELVPEAALGCDAGGKILSYNGEAQKLFQASNREILGVGLGTFLPAVQEWEERNRFLDMVRFGGLDAEHRLVTCKGVERLVWTRCRLLTLADSDREVVLITVRDITSRSVNEQRLREMVVTDALTGLHNRRYLDSVLDFEEERARRYGFNLACSFLDIDRFKEINDGMGHYVGDMALKTVARALQGCVRKLDTLCRWGGDEFVIITLAREVAGVRRMMDRLLALVSTTTIEAEKHSFHVSLSAGVAVGHPTGSLTAQTLLEKSEECLRKAKSHGGKRLVMQEVHAEQ